MKKLLLDTSILIDFLRRKDKENSLLYEYAQETLYIPIITHTELFAGKSIREHEASRKAVTEVLAGITILELSEEISETAGFIKAHNQPIWLIDSITHAINPKVGI